MLPMQSPDIAQVSFYDSKHFNHSPVIVEVPNPPAIGGILVAAHTFDTDYYRLMDFERLMSDS